MAKGISTLGDVLVNQLADGTDLNQVWGRNPRSLRAVQPRERSAVVQLLSYPTTLVADAVPQSISSDSFEEATEFGVPRAIRPPAMCCASGTIQDLDISLRATWKFLKAATAEQVQAQVTRCLEADNKLVTGTFCADCSRRPQNSTSGNIRVTHCGQATA